MEPTDITVQVLREIRDLIVDTHERPGRLDARVDHLAEDLGGRIDRVRGRVDKLTGRVDVLTQPRGFPDRPSGPSERPGCVLASTSGWRRKGAR